MKKDVNYKKDDIESPVSKSVINILDQIENKPKTHCYVDIPFVSTSSTLSGYLTNTINYFLYPAKFERKSSPFFVYSQKRIVAGEREFYLDALDENDKINILTHPPDFSNEICNIVGVPKKDDNGEYFTQQERLRLALTYRYKFLKERPFLTDSEFDDVLNGNCLDSLVDLVLHQGFDKDDRVMVLYKAHLLQFDTDIRPKRLMPFQSHSFVFTNTKVGKTTLADTIGERIDRLTNARFVGYSDAKGKNPGDIDLQTKPVFIDEISDVPAENSAIARHAMNVLELGEATISTGKESFGLRTWSSLTFHGNVKNENNAMIEFDDLLSKISTNPIGTGGRFGAILFGDEYAEAGETENDIEYETTEKTIAVWNCLEEEARPHTTKFFVSKKARKWLNESNDDYIAELVRLDEQTPNLLVNVRAFIKSHASKKNRHIRGTALKLAIVDHLKYFLINSDTIDSNKIIETAETYLEEIKKNNLESFTNIMRTTKNLATFKGYVFDKLPEYQQIAINLAKMVVQNFSTTHLIQDDKILLEKDFLKEPYKELNITHKKYRFQSALIQDIPKNRGALNRNLKLFGICVEKFHSMDCITILNSNELLSPF